MSDTIALQELRTLRCVCGAEPSRGHPLTLYPACHPDAAIALSYEGGDRLVAYCQTCKEFAFYVVIGEITP